MAVSDRPLVEEDSTVFTTKGATAHTHVPTITLKVSRGLCGVPWYWGSAMLAMNRATTHITVLIRLGGAVAELCLSRSMGMAAVPAKKKQEASVERDERVPEVAAVVTRQCFREENCSSRRRGTGVTTATAWNVRIKIHASLVKVYDRPANLGRSELKSGIYALLEAFLNGGIPYSESYFKGLISVSSLREARYTSRCLCSLYLHYVALPSPSWS